MFSTPKEFEQATFDVLSTFHLAPMNLEAWSCGLSDIDLHDVLQYLINANYLLGVSLKLRSEGNLLIAMGSPRLSYEGLEFIKFHSE